MTNQINQYTKPENIKQAKLYLESSLRDEIEGDEIEAENALIKDELNERS